MSDGALSQDEIDALLAGVDSSTLGVPTPTPAAAAQGSQEDLRLLQAFLSEAVDAQSSNLSMMTGADVALLAPTVSTTDRDDFLEILPDMITVVKADFISGFPGEHIFIMSEDTAKSIASLMNKEDNIELDDMAMSVISEVVSQLTGTQITALSDKTGNKSITSVSPEAVNITKAVAALPAGSFQVAAYELDLDGDASHTIWEVYGSSVAADIARSLASRAGSPDRPSASVPTPVGAPSVSSMPGMVPGMMPNMGGMQNMGGMMSAGGLGQPTNVQSVQFPGLATHQMPAEQGNIGLIMDVFMEMTVELGRTRKMIKEILGMGEGTIIELDKLAGEPVDILVNHKLIAKGEVVVIDENFGVRVTEIVSPIERMNDIG